MCGRTANNNLISNEKQKKTGKMSNTAVSKEANDLFGSIPKNTQLILMTLGMFVFFGTHNILQEAITKLPGFHYGVMLGYMEVLG